jgi:hypothetical protein
MYPSSGWLESKAKDGRRTPPPPPASTKLFKKSTQYALAPEINLQQNKTTFRWALRAHLLEEIV